jgi:hypothetical protein
MPASGTLIENVERAVSSVQQALTDGEHRERALFKGTASP